MAETINKRDQVKALIALGTLTKAEIAEKLDMSVASVSTQMTYLRWMDNYILTDPDTKILSFTDQETFDKLEAERRANRKTKTTATRTPEERAQAAAKTVGNQEKQLATWTTKLGSINEIALEHPDDADVALNMKEAKAMVDLLEVKLARNSALLESLPDIDDVEDDVEDESSDDLL